ncbi:MAG: hypothetical protein M9894_18175 [Planctomycetes bacterium]|nr:hypothetical protein [Planctomycetota bacterium]
MIRTPAALALALALPLVTGCAAARSAGAPVPRAGVPSAFTDTSIEIPALPRSAEEFLTLRDQLAGTPRGGAAMFVTAMILYVQNEKLGLECLTIAVDQDMLVDGDKGYRNKQLRNAALSSLKSNLGPRPYLPNSYVDGTSHESGYVLPQGPLKIRFKTEEDHGDRSKVFVYCSGADMARPITLKVNDKGAWKAWEWSSLEVGIRKPTVVKDDPF